VKPDHSFCTVCLRINSSVAMDCPWKDPPSPFAPQARAMGGLARAGTAAGAGGAAYSEVEGEDLAAFAAPSEVPQAVLSEGPIIEFAKSSEPSAPRKRVKAKAVLTRGGPSKPSAPPPPALDFGPAPLPEPAHDQAVLPPAPPPHPVPAPPPPSPPLRAPPPSHE